VTETIEITPGEVLEVRERSEGLLVFHATYAPGGSPPPPHFHPAQAERFEILAGTLHVEVDGERQELTTGDQLDIPPDTTHRMWNPTGKVVQARWETRPAGRTEEWFRALAGLQGTKWVTREGKPKALAFAALASEYHDTFRLAGGPQLLMRILLVAAARLARVRGFHGGVGRA
jgi:mannose-6-phosphate isomerase-like protein (cupin superfamily)